MKNKTSVKIIFNLLILLQLVMSVQTYLQVPQDLKPSVSTHCLVEIINSFDNGNDYAKIFVYNNDSNSKEFIDDFLFNVMMQTRNKNYSVEIGSFENRNCTQNIIEDTKYIIFASSKTQLEFTLEHSLCYKSASKTKIIIIVTTNTDFGDILQFSKTNLFQPHVVIPSWNNSHVSYKFSNLACGQPKKAVISECRKGMKIKKYEITNCIIRIGIRKVPPFTVLGRRYATTIDGLEIHALKYMAVSSIQNKVSIPEGGNDIELIKNLSEHKLDLVFGALGYKNYSNQVTLSYPLVYTNLIAIVKKMYQPSLFKPFNIYGWKVCLFILSVYVTNSIITYLLTLRSKDLSFKGLVLNLVLLSFAFEKVFQERVRLLHLSWIWFVFVIKFNYETYSSMLLVDYANFNLAKNLDSLCNYNYTIFVSDLYKSPDGFQLPRCHIPKENIVYVKNPLKTLLNSDSVTSAVFMYKDTYLFDLPQFLDEAGNNPFHVVKETISIVPFFFYTRKGEIFSHFLNKHHSRVLESGIIESYRRSLDVMNKKESAKRTSNKLSGLTLKAIGPAFLLYLFGICFSILVFILELLFKSFKHCV